jgi:hypothetical protein
MPTMRVTGQIPSVQPGVYAIAAPEIAAPQRIDDWSGGGVLYGEDDGELEPYRRRRPLLVAGVVLLVLVVGAAVGLAALYQRSAPQHGTAASPTGSSVASPSPTLGAPNSLSLRDNGGSVTLTWADPSQGRATFIVLGGRSTEAPRAFTQLPAGQVGYTVNGLNPEVDYCFRVAAVYSVDNLALSEQACTARRGTPTPSRGAT